MIIIFSPHLKNQLIKHEMIELIAYCWDACMCENPPPPINTYFPPIYINIVSKVFLYMNIFKAVTYYEDRFLHSVAKIGL